MTYSLQNSAENTTYSGNDIDISSTTGVLETNNLDIFTTAPLVISMTVSNSDL